MEIALILLEYLWAKPDLIISADNEKGEHSSPFFM
jgi:hypothetical protein